MNKTTKIFAAAALAVGLAAGTGVLAVQAASTGQNQNPMSSLVSAIAQKFNLNSADVQTVVDQVMQQNRAQREAEMQTKFADRLKQAVTDGKITQAQADQITAKQQEIKTLRDSLQGKTETEIRDAMKTQMDNLKTWATQNNIPMEYLMPFGRHGGHDGPRQGFGKQEFQNQNQTNQTNQ